MQNDIIIDSLMALNDAIKTIHIAELKLVQAHKENINWLSIINTALIPVLVAILAALASYWQIKLNVKKSARIKWIEEIRNSMSEYDSYTRLALHHVINFNDLTKHVDELIIKKDDLNKKISLRVNKDNSELLASLLQIKEEREKDEKRIVEVYNSYLDSFSKGGISSNKLMLSLGSHEDNFDDIMELIHNANELFRNYSIINEEKIAPMLYEAAEKIKIVLKKEWEKI